jgi:hypothetical protein
MISDSDADDKMAEYIPMRRSTAAGLRSSSELSSLRGVRHFWQIMTTEVHLRALR